MPSNLLKIVSALFLWATFTIAVFQIPYPESLTQADALQTLGFFTPLFLALTFTINLFLKNIFSSCSISLGIIILLILKALDSLNVVTSILLVISVGLFVSYFKKMKGKSLTKLLKISKLTSLRREK